MECHYIVIELPVYADTERWIRAPVHTTKLNGGAFRLPSLKAPVTRITTTAEWPGAQVSESGAEVDLRCRLDTVASSCLYCAAVHFSPLTHFQWLSDSLGYLMPIDRVFDWLLSEALQPHYIYLATCILSPLNSFLAMVLYPVTIGIETSI